MTSWQSSEFYLVCGIVLSWGTPVQIFTMMWPLITELIEFVMSFVLVTLDKRQRYQYNDDIIDFMQIVFHIWANTFIVDPCPKFHCDRSTNNEDTEEGADAISQT